MGEGVGARADGAAGATPGTATAPGTEAGDGGCGGGDGLEHPAATITADS